jgi:hypothetical protein
MVEKSSVLSPDERQIALSVLQLRLGFEQRT